MRSHPFLLKTFVFRSVGRKVCMSVMRFTLYMNLTGVFKIEWLLILSPPPPHLIFFPALCYKIHDFLPYKAVKQHIDIDIEGLNSVKQCCSNQILSFGTAKALSLLKFCFFLISTLWLSFPFLNPLILFPPPHRGDYSTLYTPEIWGYNPSSYTR